MGDGRKEERVSFDFLLLRFFVHPTPRKRLVNFGRTTLGGLEGSPEVSERVELDRMPGLEVEVRRRKKEGRSD